MDELCIEISYGTNGDDPEHEGYYDSIEDAKKALDDLGAMLEKEGE